MDGFERLKQAKQRQDDVARSELVKNQSSVDNLKLQETIVQSFDMFIKYLENRVSKTAVINQLKTIDVNGVDTVINSLNELHETLKDKNDDNSVKVLEEISKTIGQVLNEAKQIPKETPTIPKPLAQKDYSKQLQALSKAIESVDSSIQSLDLHVEAPSITLPEPSINVEAPDLSSLKKELNKVVSAVKDIVIPEYSTKDIEKYLKKSNKLLEELLDMPLGGGNIAGGRATPYEDSSGTPQFVELSNGAVPVEMTNAVGNVISPLDGYGYMNSEDTGTYTYVGKEDPSGNWVIQRFTNADDSSLWAKGSSGYSTAWTNRASQSYDTFDNTFDPVVGSVITSTTNISSVIKGTQDSGVTKALTATAEGHLEVAVHAPRLPFGSVHTESLRPIFQSDGVYGLNGFTMIDTTGLSVGTGSGSGAVTGNNNLLKVSTGTTQYSFASLQSRRRMRYRPGQGVVGRFAGFFTGAVANSILVAGFGTAETTLAFGYNGTSFGILYSTGGVREIHTFTVTTASTATNDYVVTLPNTDTVNVTATNNGSTTQTAFEISQGTFPGWSAEAIGSTVVFVANSAGDKSGSFSLAQPGAGTPAAGTDAETLTGVASTDTWIPQDEWNGDKLDGTGASGVTLDPTKGNVYEIGVQYLGFGALNFRIEAGLENNNPDFVTVHTILYPNTATATSMSQPSFPFLTAAYSAGSTTDASVSIGSFAGFNEGAVLNTGPRLLHQRDAMVTSTTSGYTPLFTIKNGYVFKGRPNQSVVNLLDVSGAARGNSNATTKFYLIRNASLTGGANFVAAGSDSSTTIDTSATGMATPDTDDIEYATTVTQTGDFRYAFSDREITLQPGETMTLAVKSLTATADCTGTIDTREDQ